MIRHPFPAALAGGAVGGAVGLTLGDDLIYWQQALATAAGMVVLGGAAAVLPGDARAAVVVAIGLVVSALFLRNCLPDG